MLVPAVGTATLEPGRVRLHPRENLLRSMRRGSTFASELTRAGRWGLEPHLDLPSVDGDKDLWIGQITGPPVTITAR